MAPYFPPPAVVLEDRFAAMDWPAVRVVRLVDDRAFIFHQREWSNLQTELEL